VDLTSLLRRLVDLDWLSVIRAGETSKQFSSYDRASRLGPNGEKINWGANGDAGHYLRVEPDGEAVMAEMEGPGAITQTWSANPQGKLHFYIDGAAEPIVFDFAAFTTGGIPEIPAPLSGKGGGAGCNCYLPVPYAKSCVIKADRAHGQYYHFDYTTFAPGTHVTSFKWPLSDAQKEAVRETASWWRTRCGENPGPARPGARRVRTSVKIPPGGTAVLAALEGPAVVTSYRVKLAGGGPRARRGVLLRAYWDGAGKPSLEAPYGDFFASTWADVPFKSLSIGMTDDGGYCFWRMPFARSARFEALNEGSADARLECEITAAPSPWADGTAYFHAKWRREAPNRTFDWPYLECEGRGRFVGVTMSVQNPDPPWFGEGDEKVYVDGEAFPSWFGTGTEDYFCDAWGFRPFIQPTHGCTMYHEPGKSTVYRWHILDSIPFQARYEMTIENYGNNKDYSSVAYWYAVPPNKDFFKTPSMTERIPWPMRIPGAIEAEDVAAPGAPVASQDDLPFELSGGKALRLAAGAPALVLLLPVPAAGADRLVLFGPSGQKGPGLTVTLGSSNVLEVPAPAFGAKDRVATRARLAIEKGTVELRVTASGGPAGSAVLLDAVRLEPRRHVPDALEAEDLGMSRSPRATGHPDAMLANDEVSGRSVIAFTSPAAGEWIEFMLPDDARGKFRLMARIVKGPAGGVFAVSMGDGPPAGEIDAYAPREVLSREIPVGTFELSGGPGNRLRWSAVRKADASTGFNVGIDYLRLGRIIVDNAMEAEGLKILRQQDANAQHQRLGERWSGEVQLFCPGREGEFVELQLPVAKTSRYALDIYFTKAGDYGIVEVELDGKPVGSKFNGYNNGVIPSGKVSFGTVELAEGPHRILFRSREKDERSSNCFMGIDALTLTPVE